VPPILNETRRSPLAVAAHFPSVSSKPPAPPGNSLRSVQPASRILQAIWNSRYRRIRLKWASVGLSAAEISPSESLFYDSMLGRLAKSKATAHLPWRPTISTCCGTCQTNRRLFLLERLVAGRSLRTAARADSFWASASTGSHSISHRRSPASGRDGRSTGTRAADEEQRAGTP
jgi:hypothetical protein